jgi:hypothetical protein
MGESSQNEILILIEENHTNESVMYIEERVEKVESENVQTKSNKVEKKWGTNNEGNFEKGIKINSLC